MATNDTLDKLFGITDQKSLDAFIDNLSLETEQLSSTMSNIQDNVKQSVEKIDSQLSAIQNNNSSITLTDISNSMKDLEELIELSKKIFKHVAESILTTDLIDSEVLGSAAKFVEAIHINIQEFISVYKDKQRFVDKVKLMIFQQDQKKELMLLQHKLAMEKMAAKIDNTSIDAEGMIEFDIDKVIRSIDQKKNT